MFLLRKEYKKQGDPKEYAIKILLNSLYGLSGTPVFKQLYNYNTASDCTAIGRQSLIHARTEFLNAGYEVLYSDTDSVYIQVPEDDDGKVASFNP